MCIQDIKTLIEIQALQGLTGSNVSEQASTSTMFQDILNSYLTESYSSASKQTIDANEFINEANKDNNLSLYTNSLLANHSLSSNALTEIYDNSIALTGSAKQYEDIIRQASETYNVPAKLILIRHSARIQL